MVPTAQTSGAPLLIGGSPAPPYPASPVPARTARNSPGKAWACGALSPGELETPREGRGDSGAGGTRPQCARLLRDDPDLRLPELQACDG